MLTRLCKWAREAVEPLRSYATGKDLFHHLQQTVLYELCELKLTLNQ